MLDVRKTSKLQMSTKCECYWQRRNGPRARAFSNAEVLTEMGTREDNVGKSYSEVGAVVWERAGNDA